MTLPSLLLVIVLSTVFGTLFHFWRGGGFGRLLLYLFLSWIGSLAGQLIATYTGLKLGTIGTFHLGLASLGAILVLFVGHWLFVPPNPEE